MIFGEIKIGQGANADGTHVGRRRVVQGAAKRCRGLLSKWSSRRAVHSMSSQAFYEPSCISRAGRIRRRASELLRLQQTPRQPPRIAAAVLCGRDDMAVNGEAKPQAIDRDTLRRGLVTSSTKLRIENLGRLEHQVADDGRWHELERSGGLALIAICV